jgi:hypothetical protein
MSISAFTGQYFTNQDQLFRKFYDSNSISSDFVQQSLSSIRVVEPTIDFSDFSKHVYFNSAELKTTAAIDKLRLTYPIGISGQSTASLCAENTAIYDNYLLTLNGFEEYVLNYLGGITGNPYLGSSPSVTASSSAQDGTVIYLITLARSSNNVITGIQSTYANNLIALAQSYDAGFNTVNAMSGTASDFDIVYFDDGDYRTSRITPATRIDYVNRQSNMADWMPQSLYTNDEENNLQKFMSVVGAIFDDIKLYIDQFASVNHISYDEFYRIPNGSIQSLIAKHFGFELVDTLLRQDISQYLRRTGANEPLYQVSAKIWNRVLNNLMYLYKKKGTLESVRSLIRIYGLPANYMQIDDYSFHADPEWQEKIEYRDVRVLNISNSAYIATSDSVTSSLTGINGNQDFTLEARISSSSLSRAFNIISLSGGATGCQLYYSPPGQIKFVFSGLGTATTTASASASLNYALSTGYVNIFGSRLGLTGIVQASWIDETSGSATYTSLSGKVLLNSLSFTAGNNQIVVGNSGASAFTGDVHEVKMFKVSLNPLDMQEHTENYESVSMMNSGSAASNSAVVFEWKLKENVVLTGSNYIVNSWTLNPSLTAAFYGSASGQNNYIIAENMRKKIEFSNIGEFVEDNVESYIDNVGNKFDKSNILHIGFKPINAVNNDIINVLGDLSVSEMIGDPQNFYGSFSGYPYRYTVESASASRIFERYAGSKIDFNNYIDVLENLSPIIEGIMSGVNQLIPARTNLLNRGVTIEKHLLDSSRFHSDSPLIYAEPKLEADIESEMDVVGDQQNTNDRFQISPAVTDYVQNNSTNFKRTINKNITEIQPFYQEVTNPSNTLLVTNLNRNFLQTDSTLSHDGKWTTSITGTIKLIRQSTGKTITSTQNCVRIEIPFSSSATDHFEHWFDTVINNQPFNDSELYHDYPITTTKGITFRITCKEKFFDKSIGLVEMRFTNLLSGNSDKLPIVIAIDESGFGGVVELVTQLNV